MENEAEEALKRIRRIAATFVPTPVVEKPEKVRESKYEAPLPTPNEMIAFLKDKDLKNRKFLDSIEDQLSGIAPLSPKQMKGLMRTYVYATHNCCMPQ